MSRNHKPKRNVIVVNIDVDTDKLYGPIEDAIEYLTKVRDDYPGKDLRLREYWSGYEDMTMVFSYDRMETDEEFNQRLEREKAVVENIAREKNKAAEREKRWRQYEQLRREFGSS